MPIVALRIPLRGELAVGAPRACRRELELNPVARPDQEEHEERYEDDTGQGALGVSEEQDAAMVTPGCVSLGARAGTEERPWTCTRWYGMSGPTTTGSRTGR